jgi:hypothetical protein
MKVKELIALLMTHDPEQDVVISADELGHGCDYELVEVHKYDNTDYVRLIPDEQHVPHIDEEGDVQ